MRRMIEVVVLRAAPAALNLVATVLLGQRLGVHEFGLYSTTLATLLVVANLSFGSVTFAILPYYGQHVRRGDAQAFAGAAVLAGALLAVATAALVAVSLPFGGSPVWATVIIGFGLFGIGQEIVHAQMRLVRYGLVAAAQATIFLGLVAYFVRDANAVDVALLCFAASYAVGFAASFVLGGPISLRPGNLGLLRGTLPSGGAAALGTLAEGGMLLGVRYTLLLGDHTYELGVFAYCSDLGQRVIGSVLGAATFAYVPLAYHQDDEEMFLRTLRRAAVVGSVVALAAAIVVFLLRIGPLAVIQGPFEPVVFALCCLATSVNRLKKLVVNPVLMRQKRSYLLALPYIVAIPVAIGATALCVGIVLPLAGSIGYLFSNAVVVGLSVSLLRSPGASEARR